MAKDLSGPRPYPAFPLATPKPYISMYLQLFGIEIVCFEFYSTPMALSYQETRILIIMQGAGELCS